MTKAILNSKLELLALADEFCIDKIKDGYEVTFKTPKADWLENDVAAFIKENKITYYVTNCENSISDWCEIDIERLNKLKEFCELMCEEKINN